MHNLRRFACVGVASLALSIASTAAAAQKGDKESRDKDKDQDKRPKITLKATPMISMAPSRVVLTAELLGGPNDLEEYYCPTVEWEWGDGTRSEATSDCEPYQPGKTEIKRRFTVEHAFRFVASVIRSSASLRAICARCVRWKSFPRLPP